MGNKPSKWQSSDVYHMLLVGETGSGKTSFLNLVSNVQLVHELGYETSSKKFKKYNDIKFENPSARKMESKTTKTSGYKVKFGDVRILIFDTPGFGDTRGFDMDRKNVEDIVKSVLAVEYMHCICFVINGRQARITPQFQYVVSEISAVLPKISVKNLILVLTNAKDETDCSFEVKEAVSFFGESLSDDNIFYIDNPYCKLEKLKSKRPDTPIEEIAKDLQSKFNKTSTTLEKMLNKMMLFDPLKTCDFKTLYDMKQGIEKRTIDLMVACQNEATLQKHIQEKKREIDEAVKTKTLNESFLNQYTLTKLVIVYTEDNNTVCSADGCNSNCHLSCLLAKQGDHKVKMCDIDIIKLCHCMDEVTGICTVCHHSYQFHFNVKYMFGTKEEKVTYLDEVMKKKYENAEKSIEEISTLMKEKLDCDHKKAEDEVKCLSKDLIEKVTNFEELATSANYAKLIQCQLIVVEQRIKGTPASATNTGIMCELMNTKEQLKKKLQLVSKVHPESATTSTDVQYSDPEGIS